MTLTDSSNCWFALVDFYSVEASTQARASLDQTDLVPADSTGFPRPSRVLKSKRENRTDLPLSASRCEQLANYYLGFNGWSSQTLYHRRESRTVENGSAIEKVHNLDLVSRVCPVGVFFFTHTACLQFCSAVRITFSCSPHLSSEGAGVAEAKYSSEDPEEKCRALGAARKSSRVMAQRNAFAKVLLVILPEKKSVCVEIDSTAVDPFYYNAVWEDEQSVVVNEVNTAQYESDEA